MFTSGECEYSRKYIYTHTAEESVRNTQQNIVKFD